MDSIGEAIQMTQSMYSKGVQSKDSRLAPRQIYAELLTARSTILQQQVNKGQSVNQFVYQSIPCVELIEAPIHECPCVPNGCIILKTKYKLPTAIAGLSDMLIRSVTTLDGITTIDPTMFETVKYQGGKKYTADKPSYYIRSQRGWVVNRKKLKAVTMNGLFDDPLEVYQYPSICGPCEDCECMDIMDYDFPADKKTLGAIQQLAANRLIIMFGQMKEDRENNASDDIVMGNQMIHQGNEQQGEQ